MTGVWNAVTHPGETVEGIVEMTKEGARYVGRAITGEANVVDDASRRLSVFEAAVSLEQARIYLTEGNFPAARYVSSEASEVLANIVGPGKIASVSLRSVRAGAGRVIGRLEDAAPNPVARGTRSFAKASRDALQARLSPILQRMAAERRRERATEQIC